jgi:hypothetical protein
MKIFRPSKLKIFFLIVSAILLCDVVLHKGQVRYMLPKTFPSSQAGLPKPLFSTFSFGNKNWAKAVNDIATLDAVPSSCGGIELDVYFEKNKNNFDVHHDPVPGNYIDLGSMLHHCQQKGMATNIWLDCKNLDTSNLGATLEKLVQLKEQFHLQNRIIVESSFAECLPPFANAGFFTSYYLPFFNPYLRHDSLNLQMADSIKKLLIKYPVHALSGYYYQSGFTKNYFPSFPVLTWADKKTISLAGYFFNRKLQADQAIKAVLRPTR